MSERTTLTWGSRNEIDTVQAVVIAKAAVIAGLRSSIGAAAPVEVRPFIYSDVNLTSDFINFSVSSGVNALLPATFQIPTGKTYAFYGFRDLTAGTKVLSYFQITLNGTNYPISPIPLFQAWTDEQNTVYFSPLKATTPSASMQINLSSVAAQTVSFQIVGLTAVPLSGTNIR